MALRLTRETPSNNSVGGIDIQRRRRERGGIGPRCSRAGSVPSERFAAGPARV
jgi:hypothetical protein